jgi:cytochrome c5
MHFIKTPKQFVLVIIAAFAAPVLVFFLLATLVTSAFHLNMESPAMSAEAVAKRLEPVGKVVVGEAATTKQARTGEEVFKTVCAACHTTGALNAPKIGDKEAWEAHIKEGLDVLVKNAIAGINQMPPKGGNPELSDEEVARAVVYLANQSGANFKEPAAATSAAEKAPPMGDAKPSVQATPPAAAAKPAEKAVAVDDKQSGDGKSVYESACAACHASGLAGAPKAGDKSQWAPRISQGADILYASAIKGKGAMPPKGGNPSLSDAQVKAAVDHLVATAK